MLSIRHTATVLTALALVACDVGYGHGPAGPAGEFDWPEYEFPDADLTRTWEGIVTSSVDGSPIEDVTVGLYDEHLQDGIFRLIEVPTFTDSEGFYTLSRSFLIGGKFLQAGGDAWETQRIDVTLDRVQRIDFVLEPK